MVDQQQSLSDIIWSRQTNAETYEMYVRLEKDMAEYLKAGIITESEYLNAFANRCIRIFDGNIQSDEEQIPVMPFYAMAEENA